MMLWSRTGTWELLSLLSTTAADDKNLSDVIQAEMFTDQSCLLTSLLSDISLDLPWEVIVMCERKNRMVLSRVHTSAYGQQSYFVFLTLFPEKWIRYCKKALFCNVKKKVRKNPSLYLEPPQKLMGFILGRDPSSIQVSSKSIQYFLYNPADKPTREQKKKKKNQTRVKTWSEEGKNDRFLWVWMSNEKK